MKVGRIITIIMPSNIFIKHAMCRHSSKHFIYINSFNSHDHAMGLLSVS